MKKQMLLVLTSLTVVLFTSGIIAAQTEKAMKAEMDMEAMHKSPHHLLMMAHHHSAMTFATLLRDMAKGGKLEDREAARGAFAEIKHCMDEMEMVHRMHMSGMSKEKTEKMKPMMVEMKSKMDADKALIAEHIAALEKAFQTDTPDAAEVNKHATALVMVFEKMMPSAKKMDMSGKKPM